MGRDGKRWDGMEWDGDIRVAPSLRPRLPGAAVVASLRTARVVESCGQGSSHEIAGQWSLSVVGRDRGREFQGSGCMMRRHMRSSRLGLSRPARLADRPDGSTAQRLLKLLRCGQRAARSSDRGGLEAVPRHEATAAATTAAASAWPGQVVVPPAGHPAAASVDGLVIGTDAGGAIVGAAGVDVGGAQSRGLSEAEGVRGGAGGGEAAAAAAHALRRPRAGRGAGLMLHNSRDRSCLELFLFLFLFFFVC